MNPDLVAFLNAVNLAARETGRLLGQFAGAVADLIPEWDLAAWIAYESGMPEARAFIGGEPLIFADWLEERGRIDLAERLRTAYS